jgi:hypothetical protein
MSKYLMSNFFKNQSILLLQLVRGFASSYEILIISADIFFVHFISNYWIKYCKVITTKSTGLSQFNRDKLINKFNHF